MTAEPEKSVAELETDLTRPWKRVRYLVTLLTALGVATGFIMRIDLSIAIVAMVDKNGSNPNFEEFDWDSSTKSIILSSFFAGYVLANVPSGMFIQRYGARWIFLASIASCSVLTFLIPIVTSKLGWIGLCVLRVLQGATQGPIFPSLHVIMPKWAPSQELERLSAITFSGIQVGNIIALPISGFLASSSAGWPSIFYTFGALGIAWCFLWYFFVTDLPETNSIISKEEAKFIEVNRKVVKKRDNNKVPWLALATSVPMWTLTISHCVQNWGFYMLLTEMPTYMNTILHYDIKSNGLLTALPYLTMLVLIFLFGIISDWLIKNKITSINVTRKLFNTIGFAGPMITMIGLTFMKEKDAILAVVLLILSCGINAGAYVGFQINHVDLSPNFAGVMLGITNATAGIASMVVPLVVGAIVTEEGNEQQWQIVFWSSAGVYLAGSLAFLIFGQTTIQPWNQIEEKNVKKNSVTITTIS